MFVGRRGDDSADGWHFTGVVDEFQVYAHCLTPSEVLSLYHRDQLSCTSSRLWPQYSLTFNEGATQGFGNSEGRVGAGFGLDGTNAFQVTHQAQYDTPLFSVGLWVFVPPDFSASSIASTSWLVCKNSNDTRDGYIGVEADSDGYLQATVNIGGVAHTIEGSGALGVCDWNHVVLTYDGSKLALFVNGVVAAGDVVVGATRVPGTDDWVFGSRCDGVADGNFRGVVDEVVLFERALSGEEVGKHYTDVASAAAAGAVGTWSFGEVPSSERGNRASFSKASMEVSIQRDGDAEPLTGRWELPEGEVWSEQFAETFVTINPVDVSASPTPPVLVTATDMFNSASLTVAYNASRAVYQVDLNGVHTMDAGGAFNQDSNDVMERIRLTVSNPSASTGQAVTLMFEKVDQPGGSAPIMQNIGKPIKGISALLRDVSSGEPLGIPVQLSKNWREDSKAGFYNGVYFHGYSVVRLPPGETLEAELSIVYGHYGGLPAASHAQVSMIGSSSSRMEQFDVSAIGAWGESIAYDPEGVVAQSAIVDVRPLLVTGRDKDMREYGRTNNVGGGDFMRLFTLGNQSVPVKRMRTAYHKYGPCLTEVTYSGFVGSAMKHSVTTSISRSDDYVRGTYRVRMDVVGPVGFRRFVVFGIGSDTYSLTGEVKMAYGNVDGMMSEWETESGGNRYRRSVEATGTMPWISLHEVVSRDTTGGAWANRGIVIRSWTAVVGAKAVEPWFAEYGVDAPAGASSTADVVLPPAITSLGPGDYVEAVFQLIVVPQFATDYYGPNQELKDVLVAYENTWGMILREAAGNNLVVRAVTGQVEALYPAVVVGVSGVEGGTAEVLVDGGIGYTPLTFTGLLFPTGYSVSVDGEVVDQSEFGNDFWQTDYDAGSQTWSQTYNLPLAQSGAESRIVLHSSHGVVSCSAGYRADEMVLSCLDVDECAADNGGCSQLCTNAIGSYACTCETGFALAVDGHACSLIVEVDECASDNGGCAHVCTNAIGSYSCSCGVGFVLTADGHACDEIDECTTDAAGCEQLCSNSIGSYTCSCEAGFVLAADGHSCEDMDECAAENAGCEKTCINFAGSYTCSCEAGLELAADGHACNDVDECATIEGNGGCEQTCTNSVGSYTCSCGAGFVLAADGRACEDVDECAIEGNGGCEQLCTNSVGSYTCSCGAGFELAADGRACDDMDECFIGNGGCQKTCTNSIGSSACSCGDGFLLSTNRRNCSDVDECAIRNGGCDHGCTNTIGSYRCSCEAGFVLDAGEGLSCLVVGNKAAGFPLTDVLLTGVFMALAAAALTVGWWRRRGKVVPAAPSADIKWLRYGLEVPVTLEMMKNVVKDSPLDRRRSHILMFYCSIMVYYLDIGLDIYVSLDYWQRGSLWEAAITLSIVVVFMCGRVMRRRRLAREQEVSYFHTSVFMLFWNVWFKSLLNASEELICAQLKAIEAEGLFEAPIQFWFQTLGYSSATTFDLPYILAQPNPPASRLKRWIRRLPYVFVRFLQLMSRILSLALLPIMIKVHTVFVLVAMVAIRLWMIRDDRVRHVPTSTVIGSLFNDAFLGDAHFREHMPDDSTQTAKVSPSEVSAEVLRVTWSMLWVTAECFLCCMFSLLYIKLNVSEFDGFIIGIMALVSGICMLIRGVLQWVLFYAPSHELPEPAASQVPRLFAVYFMLAAGCACVALETGLVGNDCFMIDCGQDVGAGFCTPLSGSYRCDCEAGYDNIDSKDDKTRCRDIDECATYTDTCKYGDACGNLPGSFECSECDIGYAPGEDRAQCEVDICFDGELMPREQKSSLNGGYVATSVAVVGDLNKDGNMDLIMGAVDAQAGGAVYIVFQNAYRSVTNEVKISSTQGGLLGPLTEGDMFGNAVAGLGDVDGDGVKDVVVGAFGDSDGGIGRGSVYVLLLNTDGTVKDEQKISSLKGGLVGPLDDSDNFGSAVGSVGDLDGDGVGDLVVGAVGDDDGGWDRGAVYILRLLKTGGVKEEQKLSSTNRGLLGPLGDDNFFGHSVAGVGDLDGDEVADVVVGAYADDDGGRDRGAVFVLLLRPDGTVKGEQKISYTAEGGGLVGPLHDSDNFGWSVASVDDLDGDGVRDLVVGAPGDDDGGLDQGAVYVLLMRPDGGAKAEQKISSDHGGLVGPLSDDDSFGSSVAGVADFDGDGFMDLAVVGGGAVYWLVVPQGFVRDDDNDACKNDACFGVDCGMGSCVASFRNTFSCECLEGYRRDDSADPESPCNSDVNECGVDNGGCDQLCINRSPGFSCWCEVDHYFVGSDGTRNCTATDTCE